MAFTNRHAPDDTAIKQEALTENIDVRGVGRYYPEEYSGPIQAIKQRGDLIADVPKTIAGIVLNYDEHALSTWQTEEEEKAYDKAITNDFLYKNRARQMDLSSDLEIYDARKELESQIFQARQRVANLGGAKEEEAVNEVLEQFKDKFQGRLIPDQKWQNVLNSIGSESLAKARSSDMKSDNFLALNAINTEFNEIHHSIIGMQQNPDGTYAPFMDIETGMNEFIKRIGSFIPYIHNEDRIAALQKYFNLMVHDQAQAFIELYRDGKMSADTLMTQLEGMRTKYGSFGEGRIGQRKEWTLTDNKGQALKDAGGNDLKVQLTLETDTDLFLIRAYNDAKNGIGNGGEQIANDTIADFKTAIGWDDIEKQGWSENLLSRNTDELTKLFTSQVVNVINSTASDDKKATSIKDLFQLYNTAYMLTRTKELIKELGPNTLAGVYQVTRDIDNNLSNNRSTFPWQNYNGLMTINGKSYNLGLSPMGTELKTELTNLGININSVAPKLGDTSEEAALYWQKTSDLLKKYAKYLESNNIGEVLNVTDNNVRQQFNNAVGLLTPSQIFTYDKSGNITGINKDTANNFQANINASINKMQSYEDARKHLPASFFENANNTLSEITNIPENIQAKRFLVENIERTKAAADIYSNAKECMQKQKSDGGLFSMSALIADSNAYTAYLNAAKKGITFEHISNEEKEDLSDVALNIKKDLKIPEQDYNLYTDLEQWCAIASYDQNTKTVDPKLYKQYLTNTLKDQYINLNNSFFKSLGGNAFNNTLIYKNHPALIPYANNMERLRNIGTTVKQKLKDPNLVPEYLKDLFKDVVLTPDTETGMWYLTNSNGDSFSVMDTKVGEIFDSTTYINRGHHNVDDVVTASIGSLVSAYSLSRYNDYAAQKQFRTTYTGQVGEIPAKQKPMSQEQFTRQQAARFKISQDPIKFRKLIDGFKENKNQEGAIKNVNTYIEKNMGEY